MGAFAFRNRANARTAEDAYAELVATARSESGSGGYTGTIAETHGFVLVTLRRGETFEACEARILDGDSSGVGSKYGPAACLDLGVDPQNAEHRRFVFFGWASS